MNDSVIEQVLVLYDYYTETALNKDPEVKKQSSRAYMEISKLLTPEERMWICLTSATAETGEHVEEFNRMCTAVRTKLSNRLHGIS